MINAESFKYLACHNKSPPVNNVTTTKLASKKQLFGTNGLNSKHLQHPFVVSFALEATILHFNSLHSLYLPCKPQKNPPKPSVNTDQHQHLSASTTPLHPLSPALRGGKWVGLDQFGRIINRLGN